MAKRKKKALEGANPMIDPYSGRYDLETLQRADEIGRDPKRMAGARSEAKKQREALERVERLKDKKL